MLNVVICLTLILGTFLNVTPVLAGPFNGKQACFDSHCFDITVVDTPKSRAKGLMFRTMLARDEGMLFVYKYPGEYGFWMKNMLIDIDIIWLDSQFRIVHIRKNAPPCVSEPCPVYRSTIPAQYILETRSGMADQLGLKKDMKLRFQKS